jgi:hypothetical protein
MKHIFSTLILILCLGISAQAQRFFDIQSATSDTLVNQDTIIYSLNSSGGPATIDVPYYYSIHVKADSLSGANAGFCYLQVSNKRSGDVWYTLQTLTIDGSGSDETIWEGIGYGRKYRIYFITPSGTRRVKPNCYASFKRVY